MDSRSSHCVPVLIKHKMFTSGRAAAGGGVHWVHVHLNERNIYVDSVRIILALQIEYCFQIVQTSELRSP